VVTSSVPATSRGDGNFSVSNLSKAGQDAYQVLLKAERFEEGPVGYAAQDSKLVVALSTLSNESLAGEAFKELLKSATLPGQLYALCGLYYADHPFFLEVIENYKNIQEIVETQSGCIISGESVRELVTVNASNVLRLDNSEQSFEQWDREHEKGIAQKGFRMDILNGGYPAYFKFFGQRSSSKK
jgi:hypothetical protein